MIKYKFILSFLLTTRYQEQKIAGVSLVVANYNNGPFLRDFIQSILSSTMLPEQLIIVDDGSTDGSRQILKEYEYLPIADFIYSTQNEGFANALNKGISKASTPYIMRADPDDILHPDRIKKQYDYLLQHPELCGTGCNVVYFHSETGKILNKSNFPLDAESISKRYRKGEHGIQHPTLMIKTEVFKDYSYNQACVPAEDYDLLARLVNKGYRFHNLSDALYKMRIHPSSISSNLKFQTINRTFDLRKEIFGIDTPKLKIKLYYIHVFNYRRYLLERNIIRKYFRLFIAIFCYPAKLFKRFSPDRN